MSRVTSKLQVTVPRAIAQRYGIRPGDEIRFPRSILAPSDADNAIWRENFIRTGLERDVPAFGPRVPAETLRRFWAMLAHAQGGLSNAAALDDVKPDRAILVHDGPDRYPKGGGVEAIGVRAMAEELSRLQ